MRLSPSNDSGVRVILGGDRALAYGVTTRVLNQAIIRNRDWFPDDSMFKISPEEAPALNRLRSQIVISSSAQGGRRFLPYAFTEHGAMMTATILNSPRAVADVKESRLCSVLEDALLHPNFAAESSPL